MRSKSTESPPCISLTLHFLLSFSTSVSGVYPGTSLDLFASLLLHFTSPYHQFFSVLWLHSFTHSVCQCSCYHLLLLHISFSLLCNAWVLHTWLQFSLCFLVPWLFPSFKNNTSRVAFSQMPFSVFLYIFSVTSCFLASSF